VQAVVDPEQVRPGPDRHHDLLERAVARPLADAVDRHLDLSGAVADRLEGVGHRQAEVVVAVHADDDALGADVGDATVELGDPPPKSCGRAYPTVSGMFTVVAPASTAAATMSTRNSKSVRVASWGENSTSSVNDRASSTDRIGLLQDLVLGRLQHVLAVDVGGREERVDAVALGGRERLGGRLDVAGHGTGERGDDRRFAVVGLALGATWSLCGPRRVADDLGDGLHRVEVARGRPRRTRPR
jgi:hypothetical protein